MNISRSNLEGIINLYNQNTSKLEKQKKSIQYNNYADKLSLSADAKEISKAVKKVLDAPDVRKDKVEALKLQIKSGAYNIKGELVAEKIIEECLSDKNI
jgi:negative regulator of flagellin synthesis FlgM